MNKRSNGKRPTKHACHSSLGTEVKTVEEPDIVDEIEEVDVSSHVDRDELVNDKTDDDDVSSPANQ